jgi:mRNA interferase MazF
MEKFAKGDIVVALFPFSNLVRYKIRPALVLAVVEFDNLILCQITSKPYSSKTAIRIQKSDFKTGKLPIISFVRPDKLFAIDKALIKGIAGKLGSRKRALVLQKVRKLFT